MDKKELEKCYTFPDRPNSALDIDIYDRELIRKIFEKYPISLFLLYISKLIEEDNL